MFTSSSDDVMTIEDLSDYLRIQKVTIYKHVQEGNIPGFKVGNSWRFKKSSIDQWISKQENK